MPPAATPAHRSLLLLLGVEAHSFWCSEQDRISGVVDYGPMAAELLEADDATFDDLLGWLTDPHPEE
jgi:hypothetical protein